MADTSSSGAYRHGLLRDDMHETDEGTRIIFTLTAGLMNLGRMLYWSVFLYSFCANAFFLVRRVRCHLCFSLTPFSSIIAGCRCYAFPCCLFHLFISPEAPVPTLCRPPRPDLLSFQCIRRQCQHCHTWPAPHAYTVPVRDRCHTDRLHVYFGQSVEP
jgi:hypothetical protein